jgi:hypothetical protein
MIHPIINLGALAQVLIEARVLPESARHNRKKNHSGADEKHQRMARLM